VKANLKWFLISQCPFGDLLDWVWNLETLPCTSGRHILSEMYIVYCFEAYSELSWYILCGCLDCQSRLRYHWGKLPHIYLAGQRICHLSTFEMQKVYLRDQMALLAICRNHNKSWTKSSIYRPRLYKPSSKHFSGQFLSKYGLSWGCLASQILGRSGIYLCV